jgi:hypothetical protein
MLEDFHLGKYLQNLYSDQISNKIPIGLILYENDRPANISLVCNVNEFNVVNHKHKAIKEERFWAKHQDLPIPLFHLLLHYYYMKNINQIDGDPFAHCWRERMISPTVLDDFQSIPIYDLSGEKIVTLRDRKPITFLEKIIPKLKGGIDEKRIELEKKIDTSHTGDNSYNSYKKNFVSFLRNMHMIDSENYLTESGFKLYHLGLINKPTSKIFMDYFTKELLTTGHHIDLILDFDIIKQKESNTGIAEIFMIMENEYRNKGYIKKNPNRMSNDVSKAGFLKYEMILWRALELINENYAINWKKITEICSLPDL